MIQTYSAITQNNENVASQKCQTEMQIGIQ